MWSFIRRKENLFLLIFALAIILIPMVVKNKYYILVMNIVGLNTIVVVGLNLLIGFAGQISLGHAAFYGMGAYVSAVLTATYSFPPWPTIVIAMIATGTVAYFVGYPSLKLRGHYLVMATLGFSIIVHVFMVELDKITGGPSGFPGIPNLSIGRLVFDNDFKHFYLIWTFAFFCILASINLVNSRVGRALRAIHGGEIAANTLGVDTDKYKTKVFVLSAIFASLAGSLYAHYITFISPRSFDFYYSIQVVTMVIVGGMGSVWGSFFGAGLLTVLSEILHVAEKYNIIAYGAILTIVLIFLPEGVLVGLYNLYQRRKIKAQIEEEKESSFGLKI
ncbi:MAG: branched-chain amino acid ABC transporter permease [Deltaproteobacteria bacterium RBG_16_50_11]|nr:MAG: branched-chain amino acid ABC transporter permease [Deltaproteobacteria bacterium RBG_16_50_11]